MAQPGGTKGIVHIPVDSAEFDAFLEKFMSYQNLLEGQDEAWRASSKGIKQTKTAWDDVEKSFANVVKLTTDSKFSSPSTGVFSRVEKSSKEISRSWTSIGKDVEKANKGLSSIARTGLNFSSLGLFGGVGGLVGALGTAAYTSANDLAQQNAQNRALGLLPGESKAFSVEYGRAGGDDALLAKIAQAKTDPTMWQGLIAGGLSQDEIRTEDPEQLAAKFLQTASERYKAQGANGGLWASSTGVSQYMNTLQLNQASSYGPKDFQDMADAYAKELPKLALSQQKYDDATREMAEMQGSFAQIELKLEQTFMKLEPAFETLATKAADWVTAFADSGELDSDIHAFEDAIHELAQGARWIADKLNDLFGLTGKSQNPNDSTLYHADAGSFGAGVVQVAGNLYNAFTGQPLSSGTAPAVDWHPFGFGMGGGGSGGGTALNNPGNLEVPGQRGVFQKFASEQQGVQAMDKQLQLYATRDHLNTLSGIINKYAPAKDGNDDAAYIADVSKRTGLDANGNLDMSDPAIRALVESAMIQHEGKGYKGLDAATVKAMITGQYKDPDKLKDSDLKIVPYDGQDGQSNIDSNGYRNINGLNDIAQNLKKLLGDTFSAGGGSGFRTPDSMLDKRIQRQGNQPQSPYAISVAVSAPAGSNVNVTSGSLPQ